MTDINKLIEDFASGVKSSTRSDLDAPLEGFEGWSATAPTDTLSALEALADPTPLDAAKAVYDALKAHQGRRRKVDGWKKVASKTLGMTRLSAKRWQGVLDAGIEAGLFALDETSLSYPVLAPLNPVIHEIMEPEITGPVVADSPEISEPEPETEWPPPGWVAPVVFKCGHTNYKSNGLTEDHPTQVAARADGHCCDRHRQATIQHRKLNPATNGRPHLRVDWTVRGLHQPVPAGLRRTPEREAGPGWPGLCCDPKTGLYIGGLGNNCRHYHKGKERCPAHASKERA